MTNEQIAMAVVVCILLTVCVYFIWVAHNDRATIGKSIKSCRRAIKNRTKKYNSKLKAEVVKKIEELNNDDN